MLVAADLENPVEQLMQGLVEWCHAHCGEWTPLARGCAPIAVERMSQALGKPPEAVARLVREAAELNQLDEIFAPA